MKKVNLHTDKLNNPFVSPENYFEEFSERLQKRIEGNYEPQKISKKLPFGVPENYFELLPQKIAQRIALLKKKIWYKEPAWQWAMATCTAIVLVFVGQSLWLKVYQNSQEKAEIALLKKLKTIEKEEIEQYLVANHRQMTLLEEIPKSNLEAIEEALEKNTNNDTLLQELPKEVLEETIPQNMLQEMIEEEFLELSKESTKKLF